MAKRSGIDQRMYVAGVDISGDVGSINNAETTNDALDTTSIIPSSRERISGLRSGMLDFQSYFNDAVGAAHATLSALPRTQVDALWALGSTLGDPALHLQAKTIQPYSVNRGADGSVTNGTQLIGDGAPLEDAVMLTAADDTHASATSNVGIDQTSQTTYGGIGYLQVLGLDSGTPTFLVEDSNDSTNGVDGVWATLITFASQASGLSERLTVTGTVDRWVRVTTTGTFVNADFACAFRRGTQFDTVNLA